MNIWGLSVKRQPFLGEKGRKIYIHILCGGDGTLNRFINDLGGVKLSCEILYFPGGSGNDFAHDIGLTAIAIKSLLFHYKPTSARITVEFDSPRALQVDGETVLGVTSYTVRAKVPAKV